MKKKPFHEIILAKIKNEAPRVLASAAAGGKIRDYGDILLEAVLPKSEITNIANIIRALAGNFPYASKDTESTQRYLASLAEKLEKEIKK